MRFLCRYRTKVQILNKHGRQNAVTFKGKLVFLCQDKSFTCSKVSPVQRNFCVGIFFIVRVSLSHYVVIYIKHYSIKQKQYFTSTHKQTWTEKIPMYQKPLDQTGLSPRFDPQVSRPILSHQTPDVIACKRIELATLLIRLTEPGIQCSTLF